MFISAIIAAHIATGIVKAVNDLKPIDDVFCESLIKYANIDANVNSKENTEVLALRKRYPDIKTWSSRACTNLVKGIMYAVYGVKGFFCFLPKNKNRDMTTDEYVKYIRKQHPKVLQGLVQ